MTVILGKMPQPTKNVERRRIVFRADPNDPDTEMSFRTTRVEEIDNIYEKYGFPSRSAFIRAMVELGMHNLSRDYMQDETEAENSKDTEAKTFREMIPEEKENAVDIRDELPEMIEDQLMDIIEQDPEINRSGWEVYR